ncbi:MAG: alpha-amylase family glycosyl hydrolase, partial [Promicromonosporaceae bacterium]|nr:alpha-amylase family glycosyl hydrolase [Promicromonosporaceae bacterium]
MNRLTTALRGSAIVALATLLIVPAGVPASATPSQPDELTDLDLHIEPASHELLPGVTAAAAAVNPVPASGPVTLNFDFARHGLPDQMHGGNIFHAWNMPFREIERRLPDIAAAGFGVIQTSPIGASITRFPSGHHLSRYPETWWMLYQPTAWSIGNMLGTETEFRSLTTEAASHGIFVIVDAVPNHLTTDWHSIDPALRTQWITWPGGHPAASQWHQPGSWYDNNINQWTNRYNTTRRRLVGLVDLNTADSRVQNLYNEFLGRKIDAGASGFRYDAVAHIELPCPHDGAYMCSNFFPNMLDFVEGRVQQTHGVEAFQYGELLHNFHRRYLNALPNMALTACGYGYHLRNNVIRGTLGNWNNQWGDGLNNASYARRLVPWVESHDHYGNAGVSRGITDAQMRVGWSIIAARADSTPLFLVRPAGNGFQNNGAMFAYNGNGSWRNVHGHRNMFQDATITSVNWFANHFHGMRERTTTPHANIAMIERGPNPNTRGGALGVTIVNNSSGWVPVDFPVNLPDGVYRNQVVSGQYFTVRNGRVSGHSMGPQSVAVIYNVADVVVAAPRVAATPGTSTFRDPAGIQVTLTAANTTSRTFSITRNGTPVITNQAFANNERITIGVGANIDDVFVLTLHGASASGTATETFTFTKVDPNMQIRVEFVAPANWESARIWAYDEEGNNFFPSWTNAPMMARENVGGTWVYVWNFEPNHQPPLHVIFHDGTRQFPGYGEDGIRVNHSVRIHHNGTVSEIAPQLRPTVYATPGSSNFYTDAGIEITLSALRTTAQTFAVSGATPLSGRTFTHGETITICQDARPGEQCTLTVSGGDGTRTDTRVYEFTRVDPNVAIRIEFTHPTWNPVRIWAWNADTPAGTNLIGGEGWDYAPAMNQGVGYDGLPVWYHYILPGTTVPIEIIFRGPGGDGGPQLPPRNQGGFQAHGSVRIDENGVVTPIFPEFEEPRVWVTPDARTFTSSVGIDVTLFGENMARQSYQVQGMPFAHAFTNGQTITVGAGIAVGASAYLYLSGTGLNGDHIVERFVFTRVPHEDPNYYIGRNLLLNPSFEYPAMGMWAIQVSQPTSGFATHVDSGTGAGRGRLNEMPQHGVRSFRWWTGTQWTDFNLRQTVTVPVAGTYEFSSWFQGNTISGNLLYSFMAVNGLHHGTTTARGVAGEAHNVGDPNWRQKTMTVELQAGDEVTVGMRVRGPGGFFGSVDNFTFHLVEPAPILPSDFIGGSAAISGEPVVGETLTAIVYGFVPAPESYLIEWVAGNTVLGTGPTLDLTDAHADLEIRVRATATRTGFNNGTAYSDPVTVATPPPTITAPVVADASGQVGVPIIGWSLGAPTVTGSAADVVVSVSGLPAGIDFDPATGGFAGTPTVADTFLATVTFTLDGVSPTVSDSVTFTWTIAPSLPPLPTITVPAVPDATGQVGIPVASLVVGVPVVTGSTAGVVVSA